jgi:hypothetical protein
MWVRTVLRQDGGANMQPSDDLGSGMPVGEGAQRHFLDVQATASTMEVGTTFISPNRLSVCSFAHSSDCVVVEVESKVSFAWIPRPQRARDADDLAFADRPEVPAVERIGMWLQEEKLAGK